MATNILQKKGAALQPACSTCNIGCPTSSGVKGLPKNVRDRVDGLVERMRAFDSACAKGGTRVSGDRVENLTQDIVALFASIVGDYNSIISEQGQIYPTLKHDVDRLVGLHSNGVFSRLVELSTK